MTKKRRAIGRIGGARLPPTFEARLLKSASGWYVRVSWRYGQVDDVIGFIGEHDAERWIDEKSKEWSRNRIAALRSD
ncbi:MAG: hypothetical protein ACLPX7_18685 [Xanthobacteraceae bacterium]